MYVCLFVFHFQNQCVCVCLFVYVCYLGECQTVLVLVLVFDLKVVKRFALGRSLAQRPQELDVTGRQETMVTVQLAMVPVVVHFASQDDDVTFGELQVARFLPLVGVESLATRQSWNILEHTNTAEVRHINIHL